MVIYEANARRSILDACVKLCDLGLVERTWGNGLRREKWLGWYNDYIENYADQTSGREVHFEDDRYYVMNVCICDKYETVLDAPNSLHFNDITRSSCYSKPYYMYKFRSMADLRDENGELLPDEQRLGKFGKLLRSTSLDELPSLWNVVRLETALVVEGLCKKLQPSCVSSTKLF